MKKRKYGDGGSTTQPVDQDIQNQLMDREEEKARKAFEADRTAENKAPKEAVKSIYKSIRGALGLDKKEPTKKAKGGKVGSASKRADGIASKGKTRGRMI